MTFQSPSELHADFYKKAVEIGSLSKLVSNYLKADLSGLKPNGQEDSNIYFSGDIIRQSDCLAPEIIKAQQEPFSEQKHKHVPPFLSINPAWACASMRAKAAE